MVDDPTENDEADYQASLEAARGSGWSWADIWGHINGATAAAADAGYTQPEIDKHLGFVDPAGFEYRAKGAAAATMADDPKVTPGDITSIPSARGDYADALLKGEVKGPRDFVANYAGAALDAAKGAHSVDTEGAIGESAQTAQELLGQLPTREELADATVALGGDPAVTRKNLMENWRKTGQQPIDAAAAAKNDPALAEKLTTALERTPSFWETVDPESQITAALSEKMGAALTEYAEQRFKDMAEQSQHMRDVEDRLAGKPLRDWVLDPDIMETSVQVALGFFNPAAAMSKLGLRWTSIVPEGPVGEALEKLSPARMAQIAEEQGPAHVEAARISRLHPDEREAELAKLEGPQEGEVRLFHTGKMDKPGSMPWVTTEQAYADAHARLGASQYFVDLSKEHPEVLKAELPGSFQASEEIGGQLKPLVDRKAVEELVPGYDAAGGFYHYAKTLVGDILDDESGVLSLPKWSTPVGAADKAAYDIARDDAQKSIITGQGRNNQDMTVFANGLEKFQGLVTPHVDEFADAAKAGDTYRAMNGVIGNFIGYIENRNWGGTLANSKLQPLADAIRDVNDVMRTRLQKAYTDGLIGLNDYRDNYFRHLWKDPRGPAWDALWTEPRIVGKQGSGQSFQQRTLPTYYDGLKIGLEPRIPNPIDLTMFDLGQKSRYLTALQVIEEAKTKDHAYFATSPRNPNDVQLLGAKSQFPVAQGVEMKLWGADGFHQSYNNWFSNGMMGYPASAKMMEKAIWMGNMSTGLKLALPTFHMRTVGLASIASGFGQAIEEFGRGQIGSVLLHTAEAATILPRIVTDSKVGFEKIGMFKSGASDPVVQYLTDAGLRFGPRQSVYKMGSESLVTTAKRGMAPGEGLWNNAAGAAREIAKAIGKDIRAVGGDPELESVLKRMAYGIPRGVALPLNELGRVMQTITSPLFDHWIPALKVGAGYRRMESWLDANRGASEEMKWSMARQIVKDVDNRFGELNQDTMFIPRTAKQISNMTLISTGWNYGSYRGFAGALGLNIERGTWSLKNMGTVLPSTVGTVAAFALFNGVEQYIRTRQAPWQTDTPWHDLIDYRTGGTTKYGKVERGGVPSELKEVFDLTRILANGMVHPGLAATAGADYVLGKINPFLQFIRAFFKGTDAIGNDIYTPGGFSKFMKADFEPIFLSALAQERKGSGFGFWSAMIGDREAPPFAEDWQGFIDRLQGVRDRAAKAQGAREIKENALLVNPDPDIAAPKIGRGSSNNIQRTHAQRVNDFLNATSAQQVQQTLAPGRGSVSNVRDRGQPARQGSPAFEQVWASSGGGQTTAALRGGYRGIPPETVVNGVSSRAIALRTAPSRGRSTRGRRR